MASICPAQEIFQHASLLNSNSPILFDGETHPNATLVQTGSRRYKAKTRLIFALFAVRAATKFLNEGRTEDATEAMNEAVLLLKEAKKESPVKDVKSSAQTLLESVQSDLRLPMVTLKDLQYLEGALNSLGCPLNELVQAASAPDSEYSTYDIGSIGVAAYNKSVDTFGSINHAFPEANAHLMGGPIKLTPIINVAVVQDTSPKTQTTTYYGGGALAAGNPNRFLVNVGASRYLSPDIYSASAQIELRVLGHEKGGSRKLIDHVGAGDLWLSAEARVFGGDLGGQSIQAGVTYGIPMIIGRFFSPNQVPTIGITATQCANHELGLNEGAVLVRIPIDGTHGDPWFFVSRYGTRGDASFSVQFAF